MRRSVACGGSLTGNVYTSGPITRDCTVAVSFRAIGGAVTSVPTLGEWALIGLMLTMLGVGAHAQRRRAKS